MSLPAATRRLFPESGDLLSGLLDLQDHAPFVIGRLLEDGDREDLAWLFRTYGRERIAAWMRRRGARQLSRRSRAFWRTVLGEPEEPNNPDEPATEDSDIFRALWPL